MSNIQTLKEKLNLSIEEILSFWTSINTTGEDSLYHQLFQNHSVSQSISSAFKLELRSNPTFGTEPYFDLVVTGKNVPLSVGKDTILSALRIRDEEFSFLLEKLEKDFGEDATLSLYNLSHLYRISILAKSLNILIQEMVTLKWLWESDGKRLFPSIGIGNSILQTVNIIHFIEDVERIQSSGFSIAELDYLLRHNFEESKGIHLDEKQLLLILRDIQSELQNVKPFDIYRSSDWNEFTHRVTTLSKVEDLPTQGKSLVIVAKIDDFYHLRIFDNAGKLIFSHTKGEFLPDSRLAKQLDAAINTPISDKNLKNALSQNIASNLNHTAARKAAIIQKLSNSLNLNNAVAHKILAEWCHSPANTGQPIVNAFLDAAFIESSFNLQAQSEVPTSIQGQAKAYRRLHKVSLITNRLQIGEELLGWLFKKETQWLSLNSLPVEPYTTTNGSPAILSDWMSLLTLLELQNSLPRGAELLANIFNEIEKSSATTDPTTDPTAETDFLTLLSQKTGWRFSDLLVLVGDAGYKFSFPTDYKKAHNLLRLHKVFRMLRQLGASAQDCLKWVTADIGSSESKSIRQTVKAKYDNAQWLNVAKSLRDPLRESQRDALVAYLLTNPKVDTWKDANDLYGHFLIDVEMNACRVTSRIKQAISSVQLFVQRCQMDLEEEISVNVSDDDKWKQWEWMKQYRVWEANRKVFLYPENWLEPELRDGKSSFFKEFENELLQVNVNNESGKAAIIHYLEKLDEVAHLDIIGMYHQEENDADILHVIGRTHETPHKYYYRCRTKSGHWRPWEKINLNIEGEHIIPVFWNEQLYLFWLTFSEQSMEYVTIGKGNKPDVRYDSHQIFTDRSSFRNFLSRFKIDHDIKTAYCTGKKVDKAYFSELGIPETGWKIELSWSSYSAGVWKTMEKSKEYLSSPYELTSASDKQPILSENIRNKGNKPIGNTVNEDNFSVYVSATSNKLVVGYKRDYMYPSQLVSSPEKIILSDEESLWLKKLADKVEKLERKFLRETNLAKRKEEKKEYDNFIADLNLEWRASGGGEVRTEWDDYRLLIEKIRRFRNNLKFNNYVQKNELVSEKKAFIVKKERGISIYTDESGETYKPLKLLPGTQMFGTKMLENNPRMNFRNFFDQTTIKKQVLLLKSPLKLSYKTNSAIHDETIFKKTRDPEDIPFSITFQLLRKDKKEGFLYNPIFFSDSSKTFLFSIDNDTQLNVKKFYHPLSNYLIANTSKIDGIDNLYSLSTQMFENPSFLSDLQSRYAPNSSTSLLSIKLPSSENIAFDDEDTYSSYNWELFFHAPLSVAKRLQVNQKFEECQTWINYIFHPTISTTHSSGRQNWKTKPFLEKYQKNHVEGRIVYMLQMLSKGVITPGMKALGAQLQEWRQQPFKPHVIARLRQVAYQKAVVMAYLDNLIAWGDQLFRRYSIESINEATNLYVLGLEILGPRPKIIPSLVTPEVQTYNSISTKGRGLDLFGNKAVQAEIENYIAPSSIQVGKDTTKNAAKRYALPNVTVPYFCIPENKVLLKYWDKLNDRLLKVRHCQDLDGNLRQPVLFEAVIDPGLLVRAASAGIPLQDVLNAQFALPNYRFNIVAQKASELCSELRALGSALLSAIERRDGEALSLLRSGHETVLLEAARTIRKQQTEESKHSLDALRRNRDIVFSRKTHYENLLSDKLNVYEEAQRNLLSASAGFQIAQGVLELAANFAGVTKLDWQAIRALAAVSGSTANSLSTFASIQSILATQSRREEDWTLQLNISTKELSQVDKQIAAAEIRFDIAKQELENNELQIQNVEEVKAFMESKFTNHELYNWMIGQISSVYFQSYQLAYDVAQQAEQAYRYELGKQDSETNFIQYGYWNNLKKGLLAGERLHHDLKRMEVAYLPKFRPN